MTWLRAFPVHSLARSRGWRRSSLFPLSLPHHFLSEWSLRSLFSHSLASSCPLASISRLAIETDNIDVSQPSDMSSFSLPPPPPLPPSLLSFFLSPFLPPYNYLPPSLPPSPSFPLPQGLTLSLTPPPSSIESVPTAGTERQRVIYDLPSLTSGSQIHSRELSTELFCLLLQKTPPTLM